MSFNILKQFVKQVFDYTAPSSEVFGIVPYGHLCFSRDNNGNIPGSDFPDGEVEDGGSF